MYYAIKKKYHDSHLTLIAGKTNYQIPFRELCPQIDEIIQMERDTLIKNFSFINSVRKKKYDIGIIPSTMQFSRTSHVINLLSGSEIRVGVKSIDNLRNPFAFMLNKKKDFQWNDRKIHQTDRILEIVEQIGLTLNNNEKDIIINFDDKISGHARIFIDDNFSGYEKIIGLHPGAGKVDNQWSTDNFFKIAKQLYNNFNCKFLITSGYIDKDISEKLINHLIDSNIPYVLLENEDINKLGAILKNLDLYITNDTGVMHLAGFAGGKVLSLFAKTNGFEWAPQNKNSIFIQSDTEYINDITVENVYQNAIKILNG